MNNSSRPRARLVYRTVARPMNACAALTGAGRGQKESGKRGKTVTPDHGGSISVVTAVFDKNLTTGDTSRVGCSYTSPAKDVTHADREKKVLARNGSTQKAHHPASAQYPEGNEPDGQNGEEKILS